MGYKALTQIILIIVSVVIITTYIKPTFMDMSQIQDEAKDYQEALDNAVKYQNKLAELEAAANMLSVSERRALERYLPDKIDTIAVMRDIETIVLNRTMILEGLASEERVLPTENDSMLHGGQGQEEETQVPLTVQKFQLAVAGTYEQFTSLLKDFERNSYPLEVAAITFNPSEEGFYHFNVTLETYSLINESDIHDTIR